MENYRSSAIPLILVAVLICLLARRTPLGPWCYIERTSCSTLATKAWVQIQSAVELFIVLWPQQAEREYQLSCTNTLHLLLPAPFKGLVGAEP